MMLSFNIEGEQQVLRNLQGLANKDLKRAFDRIGRNLVGFYSGAVFSSEGGVIGEKWKKGPQYHGLVRTGTMRKNFKHRATAQSLEVENTTEYFKYHQSNKPRKKLPRRVMIKLDEPRRQMIVKEIQKEYIDELQQR